MEKQIHVVKEVVEQVFAQAVALDQSGGLRNSVFAVGREIYILNYDHTVLLRFRITRGQPFEEPVSFRANDYDSNRFYVEDGKIVFVSKKDGYERKKRCSVPEQNPDEIRELFKRYMADPEESITLTFSKSILAMLDRGLSHIEFSGKEGDRISLKQRNIYNGSVIDVQPEAHILNEVLPFDLEPIGMRTNDFAALFAFRDTVVFDFIQTGGADSWIRVKSRDMLGCVACCVYDELIEIKEAKNGR